MNSIKKLANKTDCVWYAQRICWLQGKLGNLKTRKGTDLLCTNKQRTVRISETSWRSNRSFDPEKVTNNRDRHTFFWHLQMSCSLTPTPYPSRSGAPLGASKTAALWTPTRIPTTHVPDSFACQRRWQTISLRAWIHLAAAWLSLFELHVVD